MNRLFTLIFLFFAAVSFAQPVYTLQQCIDSAIANNIPVQQWGLEMERSRINWKQSKGNLLPNLNLGVNHGLNNGRSIDPFTNTYVNQSVNTANFNVGSDVVLFNGFALQNRIKENASAYEASRMEWQQQKDNLVLNVIAAYQQVLNSEDMLALAGKQSERSSKELERLRILNEKGAVRPSDVNDLKGQLMNDQLALLNAQNQLESSKLRLLQLMNKPYDPALKLQRINMEEFLQSYHQTVNEVYENSLDRFALIKAVELRKKSAEYSLKAARGLMFPTLSFGAGLNTNYSSLATDANSNKINYSNQLKNNRFSSIGIGLSIPIFNASIARNRVKLSEINLKNNELEEQETKRVLRQAIDQAYLDMTNSYERYKVLLEQVNAYEESFKAAEIRYNAGVGTSIDFLTAKDRLDRANINLINARYDFVLRKRILDYYNGKKPND